MPYLQLIELGISFLQQFLAGGKLAGLPSEIVNGIESTISALINHKQDVINKQNLDTLRG